MRFSKIKELLRNHRTLPFVVMSFLNTAVFANAQIENQGINISTCNNLRTLLGKIATFGGGIVITIAIIIFLIGGFHLLFGGGSEDAAKKGKSYIIYGVVGLIVALIAFSLPTLVTTIAGTALPTCQ